MHIGPDCFPFREWSVSEKVGNQFIPMKEKASNQGKKK